MSRPPSPWLRALLPLLLLAGLVTWFAIEALPVRAAEDHAGWESPLPARELALEPAAVPRPSLAREALAGPPLPIEVELEALALLAPPGATQGPGRLFLDSRRGAYAASCAVEFLAGPAAGRTLACEGELEIAGLPLGWHLLELRAGEQRTQRLVRVRDGEGARLELQWRAASELRGRVHGADGAPLRGAQVELAGHEASCDAEGRFVLDGLVAGPEQPLVLSARGHATQFERVHVPEPDRPARELRFVLGAGRSVEGFVHLPAAELPFARLAALPGRDEQLRTPWFLAGHLANVPIDARGHFRIDGLPDGDVELGLAHPRFVQREALLVPAAQTRPVHLIPDRLPVLSGVVRDEAGQPLAGVRVGTEEGRRGYLAWGLARTERTTNVPLAGSVEAMGSTSARTDARGRYAIGLPWARSVVAVSAAGYVSSRERFVAHRSAQRDFVLVRSQEAGDEHTLVLAFDPRLERPIELVLREAGDTPRRLHGGPDFVVPLAHAARMRVTVRLKDPEHADAPPRVFDVAVLGERRLRIELGQDALLR